ncbi:cyclic GMP-AMP synthase-like receptor 2 isoform X2 [Magallana gigas]|uniref:cyclic GMP-AMP synthase-like receptor 2 isoform X1 n=1 Tax=Magallana gigas TaxID=29159 RepID=UPI00333E8A3B
MYTKLSESVYLGMCHKIGTPKVVAFRRDIVDILELLENQGHVWRSMRSGSDREGFRLHGSDVDTMYWSPNHRVIWDFSQSEYYNIHRQRLILCDSSESPAGFTLLWLPLERALKIVLSSCVRMNGGLYISSSKYREITHTLLSPDDTIHGPCSSGTHGSLEFDSAYCFVSDFWPPSAASWIDRCHSWPPPHVVNDIVRNGCHFVAIGHKLGNHEDNEWRISFSQAEYKLVYSMNHTQFLTYGLLKLFLKEIINNALGDEDKLLCSYHMKTAVFWAIQQNTLPQWCPQNLLSGFWVCFKLLLKWVYKGISPNFFIPENNMFLSKIHGQAQTSLFRRLHGLYEKGIALLLHSPSIRSSIIDVLCNPRLTVCTDEHTLISEAEFDVELFVEIDRNDALQTSDQQNCMKILHTIEQLIYSPLTQYQAVILQKRTATILQRTAFILHNMYTNIGVNKQMYIADKMSCHMLKLAAKFGCISDMLYIAMYYYKTLRYREALSVVEMTKVKLAQPYLMYIYMYVDRERYTEAVGGQSWSTKIRQAVAHDIRLHNKKCYINELLPEQQSALQNRTPTLYIPVFVMLHFLEFLCYRHIDTTLSQAALDELQVLVHHDQGLFILDVSWEILGICQQMAGNLQAALYSYQQSLRQEPFHKILTATTQRIHELQF